MYPYLAYVARTWWRPRAKSLDDNLLTLAPIKRHECGLSTHANYFIPLLIQITIYWDIPCIDPNPHPQLNPIAILARIDPNT